MKKGITPVIAMILLILIVVALGGVFAAWTTRTWQGVQQKGGQQISHISSQMQKSLIIDNVNCDTGEIYLRNSGSAAVNTSQVGIYIGDSLQTSVDWYNSTGGLMSSGSEIASNQVVIANVTAPIADEVKVSVGAGVQDTSDKCA